MLRPILPLILALLLAPAVLAAQDAPAQPQRDEGDNMMHAMSNRHEDMGPHMKMTELRQLRPGDQQKADEVAAAARKALEPYRDYRQALADGYRIFLPNVPMKMYHFTNWYYGMEAAFHFNPDHPTSLLYEKTADGGYKLIGAMYTAPANTSMQELDSRVPLSIAEWHEHVNFCRAPKGQEREYFPPHPRFGLLGSITTRQECEAAGGVFKPQIFGWMVHVYPFEQKEADIWSVERQMENHEHGDHSMDHMDHMDMH